MRGHLTIAILALLGGAAPAAAATAIYSLTVDGSSDGLGTGPFGTVTVQESNGKLIFTETLASGFFIHDGNGNHNALAFNLTSASGITISSLSSGFQQVSGASVGAPPFGSFGYAIDCTSCAPGVNSTVTTLSFTAAAVSGSLTLASLTADTYQGQQIYFSSDLVSTKSGFSGNTGNIGGTFSSVSSVPEPAAWAMFVGGFGALGTMLRRRRHPSLAIG